MYVPNFKKNGSCAKKNIVNGASCDRRMRMIHVSIGKIFSLLFRFFLDVKHHKQLLLVFWGGDW